MKSAISFNAPFYDSIMYAQKGNTGKIVMQLILSNCSFSIQGQTSGPFFGGWVGGGAGGGEVAINAVVESISLELSYDMS